MDFGMSWEQKIFQRTVREYCEKNVTPISRDIDEEKFEKRIPDEILKGLADIGVFGCTIPEEYGGSAQPGEEIQYANIAIQEISRTEMSMSLPVYMLLTIGWGGEFLRIYAKEEVKREILPKLASGEWFWGINVTEPGAGSDVAATTTAATRQGNKFVLNGEKAYISGVDESQVRGGGHCTLVATGTPKTKAGKSMLAIIPNQLNGMTSSVYKDMGRMGLSTGGFVYEGSEVPEKYLLGEEGKGFYICMEGFNVARAVVAAACLGGAQGCLEMAVDYVKQRTAFGRPIGNNQGISFEIAEDWCRLESARLMLQKGCWMIDKYYSEPGSVTQREINPIIAFNKWWAPLIGADISQHAMMYHGAFGYTKDCPLQMAHRGVLSYVVGAEGTPNIMKLIIARDIFDLRG